MFVSCRAVSCLVFPSLLFFCLSTHTRQTRHERHARPANSTNSTPDLSLSTFLLSGAHLCRVLADFLRGRRQLAGVGLKKPGEACASATQADFHVMVHPKKSWRGRAQRLCQQTKNALEHNLLCIVSSVPRGGLVFVIVPLHKMHFSRISFPYLVTPCSVQGSRCACLLSISLLDPTLPSGNIKQKPEHKTPAGTRSTIPGTQHLYSGSETTVAGREHTDT